MYFVFVVLFVVVRETENRQWIFLVQSRTKSKKERIEKRQTKGKQNFVSEEIIAISSSGYSTATDEEFV